MKLVDLLRLYAGRSSQLEGEERTEIAAAPVEKELFLLPEVDLPADLGDWPKEWREAYEERAAIMEYDGGLSRSEAERLSEELQREAYKRQQTIAVGK